MQKNNNSVRNVKNLVFMALLVAMHLVLTRVLVIELGAYRISVGSVCTILAGLWMGPVAGGICGICADLIGCFMKGYAVNPFISLAAVLWGVIPALGKEILCKPYKNRKDCGNYSFCDRNRSIFFSDPDNCRTCSYYGIFFLCDHAGKNRAVCDHDADLLCSDLYSLFQSVDRNRNGTGRAGSEKKDCLKTVCII